MKHAAFFIFIAAAVFMCCCDAPRSEALQTRGNAIIRNGATKRFKHEAPYASTDDAATDDTDADNALAEKRAQLIAERVTSVEGVDRASVVINNNTAIIGIEVRDEMDDADVAQVKEKAEQAARAYDKNIERVVVTASDELVERLLKRADCVSGSPIDPESEGGKLIEQFTPIL